MGRMITVLLVCALGSGCAVQVKPWERGILSKEIMAWETDPMEAKLDMHIHFSKEGSSGGGKAAGGGCGCN